MVATNFWSETKKSEENLGHKVRATLWCAQIEQRLIIGLNEAIKHLSNAPHESLFCILAPAAIDDTTTHIQEVLLEAYCYENDIYMMKVDATEKLTRILGIRQYQSCVLIQKPIENVDHVTAIESELIDYCEEYWNEPTKMAISLP